MIQTEEESGEINIEQYEEVDICPSSAMEDDGGTTPTFANAADVLGQMTLLAATEFCSSSHSFLVFFVRAPHLECTNPYAIVIMYNNDESKESTGDLRLMVDFVHCIDVDNFSNSFFDNNNLGDTYPQYLLW